MGCCCCSNEDLLTEKDALQLHFGEESGKRNPIFE